MRKRRTDNLDADYDVKDGSTVEIYTTATYEGLTSSSVTDRQSAISCSLCFAENTQVMQFYRESTIQFITCVPCGEDIHQHLNFKSRRQILDDVYKLIKKHPVKGITRKEICGKVGIAEQLCMQILEALKAQKKICKSQSHKYMIPNWDCMKP